MRNRYRDYLSVKAFLIIIALASLFAAMAATRLAMSRKPSDLSIEKLEERQMPATLAVTTIALGPLRGVIANALWWRIVEQQDAGNFFEIIQLADWITALQPDNAKVWSFQAWNLAYNVAYEFPDPPSKWKWIYQALELLTREALRINPDNQNIKNEIARLFAERIGGDADVGSTYFRQRWAEIMTLYVPNGSREDLARLAAAPENEKGLRQDKSLERLIENAAAKDLNLLDADAFYAYDKWTAAQKKLVAGKTENALVQRLDGYFRAKALREKFRLEAKRMLYIDEQYGPFDWRLPQAFTVYWAATGSFEDYLKDRFNAQPLIRQAMQSSFIEGRLLYDPTGKSFIVTTNFKIMGKLHDYYDYLMDHHYSPLVDATHKGFMENAAAILYSCDEIAAAQRLFDHYRKDYPDAAPDFETFIATTLYRSLHNKSFKNQKALIESALFQAFNWLAAGDPRRATGYAKFAKLIWTRHQKRFGDRPAAAFPPFENFVKAAYARVLDSDIAPDFKKRLTQQAETQAFDAGPTGEKVYLGDNVEKDVRCRPATLPETKTRNPGEIEQRP